MWTIMMDPEIVFAIATAAACVLGYMHESRRSSREHTDLIALHREVAQLSADQASMEKRLDKLEKSAEESSAASEE